MVRLDSSCAVSRRLPWPLLAGLLLLIGCADADARRRAEALASADTPLDSGAVRQPIPPGIDPAMVTWRGDGLLVPSTDSLQKTPGYVVDSIFPPEVMLARFQQASGAQLERLADGATSTDALLRAYWAHLVRGDTLALRPLVVNRSEFAWLYLPDSPERANGMPPEPFWLLLSNNSGRGLTRALRAAANGDTTLVGTTCVADTIVAGASRVLGPCAVIRRVGGRPDSLWIVQHVLVRDGIFKLMSFANDL